MFHLALAAGALLLATPLLLLVAILIKLDSRGPIFFVQRRYGFNQQPSESSSFAPCTRWTTVASRPNAGMCA